ncbi:MAG: amino acid synthesis family protein [Candidatus Puniceispirillaceae bacterium]
MQRTPEIRKMIVTVEDIHREAGTALATPSRKCVIAAVITNPLAGAADGDLEILKDLGADISARLVARGLEALGAGPDDVQSYGKGAIVGVDGEIEHAAALIHPRFGAPVRGALGDASEIIPSTKKVGGPGAALAVPLTSKHSIWEFDHMDAAEISVPDAPHAGEIVVILALGIGGRPLKRIRPD